MKNIARASVGVVGGGPAGLSIAKLLVERGAANVTVFETSERVGGKSYTIEQGGSAHEMGTCYSTLSYKITNRWMKRYGIRQRALGRQVMDDAPLMHFVRQEPGAPMVVELGRFLGARREFAQIMRRGLETEEARAAAAEPFSAFLDRHQLKRMRRFMLRAITSIGYGPLEDISTEQALRWATPDLFLSGLFAQLKMPDEGWQRLWEKIAGEIDVRRSEPVNQIEKLPEGGAILHTPTGATAFDHVIITTALDEIDKGHNLGADVDFVAQACRWNTYVTTLCEVDGWFDGHRVEAYTDPLTHDAPAGLLLSVRRDPAPARREAPKHIYLTGQYGHGLDAAQLKSALAAEIASRGARLGAVYCQKRWKYFPRYDADAIRDGLLARMEEMQGRDNIWFSGATFSHEAVGSIVAFNSELAARILPRLYDVPVRSGPSPSEEPRREPVPAPADPSREDAVPAADRPA